MADAKQLDRLALITKSSLSIALPELPRLSEAVQSGVLRQPDAAAHDVKMRRWLEGVQNVLRMNNSFQEINEALDKIAAIAPDVAGLHKEIDGLKTLITQIQNNNGAYVLLAGSIMTGYLTLSDDPTLPRHAATKRYVDNVIQDKVFVQTVLSPAYSWGPYAHGMNKRPVVRLEDLSGNEFESDTFADETYVSANHLAALTGRLICS